MQRHLLRIAIALITFCLGLGATLLWVSLRAPGMRDLQVAEQQPAFVARPAAVPGKLPPGALQSKAISKPQPAYPPQAAAARVQGQVVVKVVVDETGRVISAEVVAGHALLREAAVQAAARARFAPTLVSGRPVKASGLMTYNFVLQ